MQCNPKPQPGTWRYARVTPTSTPPMTKEQFLTQYVLARATIVSAGFSGDGAAETAVKAWDIIQKACAK